MCHLPHKVVTKSMGDVYVFEGETELVVKTPAGELIGSLAFREVELDYGYYVHATNVHLEGPNHSGSYKGQGIGEALVRMLFDRHGRIQVHPNDGIPRDDGSHLTGDAPGFWSAMHKKGLIFWSDEFGRSNDSDYD